MLVLIKISVIKLYLSGLCVAMLFSRKFIAKEISNMSALNAKTV